MQRFGDFSEISSQILFGVKWRGNPMHRFGNNSAIFYDRFIMKIWCGNNAEIRKKSETLRQILFDAKMMWEKCRDLEIIQQLYTTDLSWKYDVETMQRFGKKSENSRQILFDAKMMWDKFRDSEIIQRSNMSGEYRRKVSQFLTFRNFRNW